jgi:GalNAc-alpha-(1->4)-GalNAc-alpha-(1->3)-diNAcBac-PP-undecaprenol alpha-1,4-N-acetyl-D-galactosaminyltransferase
MTKRICIVINSLVQGGAQKSAILLASELKLSGNEVQILTFYPQDTDFFKVPEGIQIQRFIYPFQDRGRIKGNRATIRAQRIINRLRDFKDLRESFSRFDPDLVISFEAATSVLAYFANKKSCPIIVSERIHPSYHQIPRWAEKLRPFVYKAKNVTLHCQGKQIAAWMEREYKKKIFVIPNFLGSTVSNIWSRDSTKIKIFSRYCDQKGIDLAIHAWSKLPSELKDVFSLEVFGDGDKSRFQKIVDDLDLGSSIKLLGPTKNVEMELSDCLIFLLPSRFEGFPNSLTEAMNFGIPSLVSDCPSAIRDITLNGKLAKLVEPNSEHIFRGLVEMIGNKKLLEELNQNGRNLSRVFNDENTVLEWQELINWVLGRCQLSEITCKSCQKVLCSREVIGMRTKHGLIRELLADWDVEVSEIEMNCEAVLAAYQCESCGTVSFSGEQGNGSFYDACYRSPRYSRMETWDYSVVIDELNDQPKVKILDFGGGISPLIKLIGSQDRLVVIDLSESVRADLQSRNIECYSSLSNLSSEKIFDFIMFSHTIEHVDEPRNLLKSLIDLLKIGGKIAITTPDSENIGLLDSPLAWPPHHTVAFKATALHDLMSELGLKDIQISRNSEIQNSKFDFMIVGVK